MNIGKMTTYQVNSTADNFFHIKTLEDLDKLKNIKNLNKEIIIFGGGSNILLIKEHYENKLFIKYDLKGEWEKTREDENNLYFDIYAGENISKLISKSLEYTNVFNYIYGLPGNIAGAIIGNTGSFGTHIGEFVESVYIYNFDNNNITKIDKDSLNFSRKKTSTICKQHLITKANIRVPKKYRGDTLHYIDYAKKRIETQPIGNSCGKYFFNPSIATEKAEKILIDENVDKENWGTIYSYEKNTISVKWMIEQIGLKGYVKNGVQVSNLNPNFLINIGTNKGKDIYDMGNYIKKIIKNRFDIELKEKAQIIA